LDDDFEKRFRRFVFEKYGGKKGVLAKAVEDALEEAMRVA
jgi:hypothetical protein